MARAWRIEYEGAFYHVLSRGNEQRPIFSDDHDYAYFIELLADFCERFCVDVFAYVLMGNHYHMLIRTNRANLSKAMQWIAVKYTRYYNLKHLRSGHLFQGRFKSIVVENDAYVMQLSCYIHRNPLRAKMVRRMADYRWSSFSAYAYGKSHPNWLNTKLILSQFQTKDKHKAYREKVQKYAKQEKRLWDDFHHGLFLGTKNFIDQIKSRYLPSDPDAEMPQQKRVFRDHDPSSILKQAASILDCELNRFRESARIAESDKQNRDLLIFLLWETGNFTNQHIGNLFGLGYSSISQRAKIIKSHIHKDPKIMRKYNQLKSQIKI